MTFKQDWEKTLQPSGVSSSLIEAMIFQAFPNQQLKTYEVISGGCANLNVKFYLQDGVEPYILRIYLRDPQAAELEQHLSKRLQSLVPIPKIYYVGYLDKYSFAIMQFMPGITLRDHLLNNNAAELDELMFAAGAILAKLTTVQFECAGFFNPDLSIKEPHVSLNILSFAQKILENPKIKTQLGNELCAKVKALFKDHLDLLPDQNEHHLVHGDYDPANILVQKIQGKWQISGILDWEFAFSGSVLWDVANMLRYAHHMPPSFETAFLDGLQKSGIHLPKDWKRRIAMLNIASLLDCLIRSNPQQHPRRCADIGALIHHFSTQLI